MVTTFKRICLQDHTIIDDDGISFTLRRGQEYTTGPEENGKVRVFSQYWVVVPANLFAGAVQMTGPKPASSLWFEIGKLPNYEIASIDLERASVFIVEDESSGVWLPLTTKFIRLSDLMKLLPSEVERSGMKT